MKEIFVLTFLFGALSYLVRAFWRRYRKVNPDESAAERAFIIFLLFLGLTFQVMGQPTRPWYLTADSNVVAPYEDIVRATAYRLEADSLADSYFEEGRELETANEGLKRALADCMNSANGKQETIELYKHDLGKCQEDNGALTIKLAKLVPWATIGKITVGVTVVGAGVALYNELKP